MGGLDGSLSAARSVRVSGVLLRKDVSGTVSGGRERRRKQQKNKMAQKKMKKDSAIHTVRVRFLEKDKINIHKSGKLASSSPGPVSGVARKG
ncbi:putative c6 zinc finger domain-containing protein [Anopheles sinensis]|uniref:Putative c6 zinc finger domain-containing protein n=1 Tax=Anopheles sinensis TaxID=74873 RepID=A0A084W6Y8_ANOSI|nr:putative c6 zinc finger domain-containing protein [Anopheles sinensis]